MNAKMLLTILQHYEIRDILTIGKGLLVLVNSDYRSDPMILVEIYKIIVMERLFG